MITKIAIIEKRTSGTIDLLQKVAQGCRVDLCVVSRPEDVPPDVDIVYWRLVDFSSGVYESERALWMNHFLKSGVNVVNRAKLDSPYSDQKKYQQTYMNDCVGVRTIQTFQVKNREGAEELFLSKKLDFPAIAKPNKSSRGRGICFLNSKEDLLHITDVENYVFQPYIRNKGDYRVYVVGGVTVAIFYRVSSQVDSVFHLNNVSQGADLDFLEPGERYEKIARLAEKIALRFNTTFAGVDIIEEFETDTLFFLEINTVMGLMTEKSFKENAEGKELKITSIPHKIIETLVVLGERRKKDFSVDMIRECYEKNLRYLSFIKQEHFLTRMYLWTGEQRYKDAVKDIYCANAFSNKDTIDKLAQNIFEDSGSKNVSRKKYRAGASSRHAEIYSYNKILFRMLIAKHFDGENYREVLNQQMQDDMWRAWELLKDMPDDRHILSTAAVNFVTLSHLFLPAVFTADVVREFIATTPNSSPSLTMSKNIDARIYFLTHAIIGLSGFYTQHIVSK
jgi:glutathione synthase/RimK-type ligase-like ATP-grasp enzyme